MKPLKTRLLSSSVLQRCIGGGILAGGALALAACSNPYAAPTAGSAVAPAGLEQPTGAPAGDRRTVLAASPCAAASPCGPCAPCAPAAGPCAPAAGPCAPCAPAAAATASECEVPRLVQEAAANPCAAVNPCAAQNPCAPCAAVVPCAPCSPCAAAGPCGPCDPCAPAAVVELTPEEAEAAHECIKPDMQAAYTAQNPCAAAQPCGPCNPCAAVNPCNPCAGANPCAVVKPENPCAAAGACSPCNPCAAVNPCSPCAAADPCSPCAVSPCGPQAAAAVPDEVAAVAEDYLDWTRVNTAPYVSATHGSRYVNNYPDPDALDRYLQYEEVGTMPAGARIAKDSFTVSPDGQVEVGPLFIMEKMPDDFDAASGDWRYAMMMPDGSLLGVTGGPGSEQVQFCAECHAAVAETQDSFLPEELRVTSR